MAKHHDVPVAVMGAISADCGRAGHWMTLSSQPLMMVFQDNGLVPCATLPHRLPTDQSNISASRFLRVMHTTTISSTGMLSSAVSLVYLLSDPRHCGEPMSRLILNLT